VVYRLQPSGNDIYHQL